MYKVSIVYTFILYEESLELMLYLLVLTGKEMLHGSSMKKSLQKLAVLWCIWIIQRESVHLS